MNEDVIGGLRQCLRGPRSANRRLLAEAESGLNDACGAYLAAGMTAAQARARALAEFGSLAQLVPSYQRELDVVDARGMARLSVALAPLFGLFWNVIWELNPYPTWPPHSTPFLIAIVSSVLGMIAFTHGMAVLVLTGRYGPGWTWTRMQPLTTGLTTLGIAAFAVPALMVPTLDPNTLRWPPTIATLALAATLGFAAARRRHGDLVGQGDGFGRSAG